MILDGKFYMSAGDVIYQCLYYQSNWGGGIYDYKPEMVCELK